jgi:hypothetical protein
MDVLGEEMGGGCEAPAAKAGARLIVIHRWNRGVFAGITTFGTLLGIERDGEIVSAMVNRRRAGHALVGVSRRAHGERKK